MGENEADTEQASGEEDAPLPDLNPWSQVGWIFRDGDCVAIERHGEELDPQAPGPGGLMVRVTQLADDGTETAAIEVDDFTIEVIYSGLAEMLREAAAARPAVVGAFLRAPTRGAPAPPTGPQPHPRLIRAARKGMDQERMGAPLR